MENAQFENGGGKKKYIIECQSHGDRSAWTFWTAFSNTFSLQEYTCICILTTLVSQIEERTEIDEHLEKKLPII